MFFRRRKEKQDQYKKDLEHLKQMQAEGKISASADLDILAKNLAKWRGSDYWADKQGLANFGTDEDLDILENEDVSVRMGVAWRGRDCDLDKLVFDPSPDVRKVVAEQERPQDLDILLHDLDPDVRRTVAKNASPKQLEKMVTDPDLGVRYILAYRGNDNVRKYLMQHDPEENVRKYAKECLEFGGEEIDLPFL